MECTPGEDTGDIADVITKDLEHGISLVDKAAVGFKRIDSIFFPPLEIEFRA
jgi:hypothetical protein